MYWSDSWQVSPNENNIKISERYNVVTITHDNIVDVYEQCIENVNKPTCFSLCQDGSVAAFLRSARAEFTNWDFIIVINETNKLPEYVNEKEIEFRFDDKTNTLSCRRLIKYDIDVDKSYKCDTNGFYIISGGLGFIGSMIAKQLHDIGVPDNHIVLLSSSRSKLPEDWSFEFQPLVELVDITNLKDVKCVFDKYKNIKGIVHAAGTASMNKLLDISREEIDLNQIKVKGINNITKCIDTIDINDNIDFVLLCSSIASGMFMPGQAAYAAANGYFDYLATQKPNYISIRWAAWTGGGMGDNEYTKLDWMKRQGIHSISSKEGQEAFLNIISQVPLHNVVTVVPLDCSKLNVSYSYFDCIRTNSIEQDDDQVEILLSELESLKSQPDKLKERIEKLLLDILKTLGIGDEAIQPETPWGDLSVMDSLTMVEMVNLLRKNLPGIVLHDTALFDYPSMSMLTTYIIQNISKIKRVRKFRSQTPFKRIAIISMACDLPSDIDSPHKLWGFLNSAGNAMTEIPEDRFDVSNYPEIYVNSGAFLKTMYHFDNDAFKISESEAKLMDPKQRKCLELTAELMDYLGEKSSKSISDAGVFIGCTHTESDLAGENNDANTTASPFIATGGSAAILSNRISYNFGLKGPSMTIDTACSSSIVALDAACKAIHSGDCKHAIVLGANMLTADAYIGTCAAKMLSPNGRCATFSDKADGYARGEGFVGIIIKDLDDAIRDKDDILAVIESVAVNQDGKTANLTSPNGPSQEDVIEIALARAELTINDIDFIETHGTGTALGDPQEVLSINNVFENREKKLPLGAIKSNFGHLEGAAGLLGLIKIIKSFQHERVPRNIHCDEFNPRIIPYIEDGVIEIPNKSQIELDHDKKKYYAGLSSFGFGGTNTHCILGFYKSS